MNARSQTMQRVVTAAAIIIASLALPSIASAQVEPTWNRSVEAIAVMPDGTLGYRIVVVVGVEVEDLLTFGDLSALVILSINGSVVDSHIHEITSTPPGVPSGCTGCLTFQSCVCCSISPGRVICGCGGFVAPTPNTWSGPLSPGDELSVLLLPADGSLPEEDMSDNQLGVTFSGDPIFWGRRVVSAEVEPSSRPEGTFDLFVAWEPLFVQITHDVNISTLINVTVNGALVSSVDACADNPFLASPDHGCIAGTFCDDAPCGSVSCAGLGVPLTCLPPDPGVVPCRCAPAGPLPVVVPGLALTPGDLVTITLDPSPGGPSSGGLPNLADLEPFHTYTLVVADPCAGDLNGDGTINSLDLLALLAAWGPCGIPCPEDIDGDGVVGFSDVLTLLVAWGPCA